MTDGSTVDRAAQDALADPPDERHAANDPSQDGAADGALSGGLDGSLDADDGGLEDPAEWSAWANLWQVPAIALSVVLIGLGLWVAAGRAPENDFDGALDQVDHLVALGDLDQARDRLSNVIEPNLVEATPPQRARFHAALGDWIAADHERRGAASEEGHTKIDEAYATAFAGGLTLDPGRLERWANALVALGRLEEARERLADLEALTVTENAGPEARRRVLRVMRRLVEYSLRQDDLDPAEMIAALDRYREDPKLRPADRAWAVARQTELRLAGGDGAAAIDQLLVEMRRMEDADQAMDDATWGELYALLGRAYHDTGRTADAAWAVDSALERLSPGAAARAEALLVLAEIELAASRHETALEQVDEIVREFPGTRAHLPALLLQAELRSVLGEYEASLADYARVIERLAAAPPRADVTPLRVASSLADRHDAALLSGDLERALAFVSLAERLFDRGRTPVDVLWRIAATSLQLGRNLLAAGAPAESELAPSEAYARTDPAVRHAAAQQFRKAGEYFLRHARLLTTMTDREDDWARSLRMAGESFDLAGRRQRAIELFREYVEGRPVNDPERPDVTFMLARAEQAEQDWDAAIEHYRQVIAEHPRSTFGTASHVPLARCYEAAGRRGEAVQQLNDVLDGRRAIMPDAADYRDALIELGIIHYEADEMAKAVELLSAAVQRYPDEVRINEMRYRLADARRRLALVQRERVESGERMPPAERIEIERRARELLETAQAGFEAVCAGYDAMPSGRLAPFQRDFERYAWFARADCAYDLERYEEAARHYDAAARRYGDHYASMHALVQIVNSYERKGDRGRADIAHQNALIRLRQLPAEAFDDPEALMDRAAWEQWLRNRPVGLAQTSTNGAPN